MGRRGEDEYRGLGLRVLMILHRSVEDHHLSEQRRTEVRGIFSMVWEGNKRGERRGWLAAICVRGKA